MSEHPIESLMTTAMESIRDMVDVNTIVGDAVQAPDGTVIIPISRVAFGFAAGGGEYAPFAGAEKGRRSTGDDENELAENFPFAGGSGAGVSINPVAFVVVGNGQIRLLPVNVNSPLDRIIDLLPELLNTANEAVKKKIKVKKEIKTGEGCAKEKETEGKEEN